MHGALAVFSLACVLRKRILPIPAYVGILSLEKLQRSSFRYIGTQGWIRLLTLPVIIQRISLLAMLNPNNTGLRVVRIQVTTKAVLYPKTKVIFLEEA